MILSLCRLPDCPACYITPTSSVATPFPLILLTYHYTLRILHNMSTSSTERGTQIWSRLPDELTLKILDYLPPQALLALSEVSWGFNGEVKSRLDLTVTEESDLYMTVEEKSRLDKTVKAKPRLRMTLKDPDDWKSMYEQVEKYGSERYIGVGWLTCDFIPTDPIGTKTEDSNADKHDGPLMPNVIVLDITEKGMVTLSELHRPALDVRVSDYKRCIETSENLGRICHPRTIHVTLPSDQALSERTVAAQFQVLKTFCMEPWASGTRSVITHGGLPGDASQIDGLQRVTMFTQASILASQLSVPLDGTLIKKDRARAEWPHVSFLDQWVWAVTSNPQPEVIVSKDGTPEWWRRKIEQVLESGRGQHCLSPDIRDVRVRVAASDESCRVCRKF